MTDDAVWQTLVQANGKDVDWTSLQGRSLVSQEVNPLYTELSARAAKLELTVKALFPRQEQLSQELTQLSATLHELDTSVRADEAALEKHRLEREAIVTKLEVQREVNLAALTSDRALQLTALSQARALTLADMERKWSDELATLT